MIVTARYRGSEKFANDAKITVRKDGVPLLGEDGETIGRVLDVKPDGRGGLFLTLDIQDQGYAGACSLAGFGVVYGPDRRLE